MDKNDAQISIEEVFVYFIYELHIKQKKDKMKFYSVTSIV